MNTTVVKYFLFVLSPFLAVPIVLHDIYKRKDDNYVLISLLFGLLSYAYIPLYTNDKAYYYELYEYFSLINFDQFVYFLTDKPDFIFYLLVFLFAKLAVSVQFLFLAITTFTVWVWFKTFNEIQRLFKFNSKEYLIFFLLVLFSFSIDHLLSGTRNYFAFSFVALGFLNGLIRKSKLKGLLFLILGVCIHFSSLIFLPFYFLLVSSPNKHNAYRTIFLFSFAFILVPREFIFQLTENIGLPAALKFKLESYLGDSDFIENSIKTGNINNYIQIVFNGLWSYFAYAYLIFTIKRKSILRNLTLVVFAVANIFYSAPDTYFRYLLIAQLIFIVLLVYEYGTEKKSLSFHKVLLAVFIINFFGNIYAVRDQILKSYINLYSSTSVTYFMKEQITYKDFIE